MAYKDYEAVPIAELPALEGYDVWFASIHGEQPDVPYPSEYVHFFPQGNHKAHINISTPERGVFLEKSTEEEAEAALVGLVRATHDITAGVIDIHPFYGAVYGTHLDSVAPGFSDGIEGLHENLSTAISLVPNGHIFSDTLSEEAAELPLSFSVPSIEADRFLANLILSKRANPNQSAKDQATGNGLGDRWQAEFDRYNPLDITTREPMTMSLGSIALLMETLNDRGVFDSSVAMVRVGQPEG